MVSRPGDAATFLERKAVRPLKVIVVGAGIGGLAAALAMRLTGHEVVVLEKVHERKLAEAGLGIQVAPNAARILQRFGVLNSVMKHATVLQRNSMRRFDNDEEIGFVQLQPSVESEFGFPIAVVHRADLHRVLLEAVKQHGCQILPGHEIVDIDPAFDARVLAEHDSGILTWFKGDLVLAADGMNSLVRKRITNAVGHEDRLVPTGDAAYRFLLERGQVQDHPRLLELFDEDRGTRYMGPGRHLMGYPLRKNTVYNVVLLHPVKADELALEGGRPSWNTKASKQEMIDCYKGWSPLIQEMLHCAPERSIMVTTMNDLTPLPTWYKGRIALVGDACHYMLPFVAQGAANAIEDAAVIASALTCTDDVEIALGVYETVRKERGEKIQESATVTGATLHLADGDEQIKRDRNIRLAGHGGGHNPDKWNDREWTQFMWGADVMRETIERWDTLVTSVEDRLARRTSLVWLGLGP